MACSWLFALCSDVHHLSRPRTDGRERRRVAHLRRRSGKHALCRRTIRSTRETSASCRSRGDSRPMSSAIRPDFNLQTTPLMINGVLYADGRLTGATQLPSMQRPANCCGCTGSTKANAARRHPALLSGRGVAYWTDGKGDERIFMVTFGYQLVALEAKTGHPRPHVRPEWRSRSQAEQRPGA